MWLVVGLSGAHTLHFRILKFGVRLNKGWRFDF